MQSFDNKVDVNQNSTVPKHPAFVTLTATKGAGKTTCILNLVTNPKLWGNTFHQLYWVSPTSRMDRKIRRVLAEHNNTVIIKNKKLEMRIREDLRAQEQERKATLKTFSSVLHDPENSAPAELTSKNFKLPRPDLTQDDFFPDTEDIENFVDMIQTQQENTSNRYGEDAMHKICIIFDDCMSGRIMNNRKFQKFAAASRHYNVSCVFAIQNYHSLDKVYRELADNVILFASWNARDLSIMHEENEIPGLDKDNWLAVFRFCTDRPY